MTDATLYKLGVVGLVEEQLAAITYDVFSGVLPEPEIDIAESCLRQFQAGRHDSLIAVGGGSAIDIAKAVSAATAGEADISKLFDTDQIREKGASIIAIPTTAGTGSEVTNIAILSDKKTQLKKES